MSRYNFRSINLIQFAQHAIAMLHLLRISKFIRLMSGIRKIELV